MSLQVTFKDVCKIIKKDKPDLIDNIDKLLGLTLVCAPIFMGAELIALLPALAYKNELTKIGKDIFEKYVKKQDADYLVNLERMQTAYGLLCFTAFFEALDKQLPEKFRNQLKPLSSEKEYFSQKAIEKLSCSKDITTEKKTANPFENYPLPFPHPTQSLGEQKIFLQKLWQEMTEGFIRFLDALAIWEQMDEKQQKKIIELLNKLPEIANQHFDAQYYELARQFPDFAIWANLHEHKETHKLIAEYVQSYADLTLNQKNIDIGFERLEKTICSIPADIKKEQAKEIVENLKNFYQARIQDPIIENKNEQTDLIFPPVCKAFVPQSCRVLRYTDKMLHLEEESTWNKLNRRNDLGAFLFSYLRSPHSTQTPLVILGHPGSGKSLLTKMLAAKVMSSHYTVIRVSLREVNADAEIKNQIEEALEKNH